MNPELLHLAEPEDYFKGCGARPLPTPEQVLLFLRKSKGTLQQTALQNRSHHRILLCFNLETEGNIHLDHLELPLKPGQAVLILPYQFHHYSQLASSNLKWLFCSFDLEPAGMLEPFRNRVIDPSKKSMTVLQQLLEEWHAPDGEIQTGLVQCTLIRLLLTLRQDIRDVENHAYPEAENSLLRTVNRLLQEWRGRTVIVGDLALEIGYSESRLRVLFKQASGISLGTYIQNHRLNRTMSLLRTTSLSIADVAEEAGFGSPQACSRMFKQATGISPRDYRSGKP